MSTTESENSTGGPPPGTPDWGTVQASDDFQQLRRRLRGFVFPVTAAFLAWYLLYVLLASFAADFMATPVLGNINLGLILGLLQFVSTFAITVAYVRFAGNTLDPLSSKIRDEIEGGTK
ncbi:putative membrane protein [Pseudonocardia sp. Ae168_Ps1]|uniref:DUF485 domain-containing protein n=1 Tax=unclassified Pseudonocardia TaxID=2619320 RepID=UPI00094AB456|nr:MULTISPECIES: DUF485 domain-containing protein [unclassified Pseudonocardia]OLL75847.1 putative membrane protein [Pseudonocardia sp. Ae150A_Ps1]OLL81845.1 putative membrane protein [Pseudonocardia sp. Ae168_Ps1]OLL84043.1 putative membrane protein [Pseudonocardia sp. Ae263_Ps1]OLL95938.1 putative membrane protein [Pseudonocardia sp. Ae356_Ps1]